jgi:hypothetical protein
VKGRIYSIRDVSPQVFEDGHQCVYVVGIAGEQRFDGEFGFCSSLFRKLGGASAVNAQKKPDYNALHSEVSRDVALSLRQNRFAAFDEKIVAAENLLMSVQGLYRTHLCALGLWGIYEEMTAGQGSRTMLIKIADFGSDDPHADAVMALHRSRQGLSNTQ